MKIVASGSWVLFLTLTFILGLESSATAQTDNPCDRPNNLPASFFEVTKGPDGDWKAFVAPDQKQAEDPEIPLVVAGAGGIQGPAHRRGMRLGCGLLQNRSQKSVAAVHLRWILIRKADRAAIAQLGYTANTVLQDGHSVAVELRIPSKSFRRTDFSIISFAQATQALLIDGRLSGDYVLLVGVHEVLFEDGSVWNAGSVLK